MNGEWGLFDEEAIITGVFRLIDERVNEALEKLPFKVPHINVGALRGSPDVCAEFVVTSGERTEKERVIRINAYAVAVSLYVPESEEAERYCYAYAYGVDKALEEGPLFISCPNRTVLTEKKYFPPKTPNCGDRWKVVLTLRVTVEGFGNDN